MDRTPKEPPLHLPPRRLASGRRPLELVVPPERVRPERPLLVVPRELLGTRVLGQLEGLRPPMPEAAARRVAPLADPPPPPPLADLPCPPWRRAARPPAPTVPDKKVARGARREPRRGVGEAAPHRREPRVHVREDKGTVPTPRGRNRKM